MLRWLPSGQFAVLAHLANMAADDDKDAGAIKGLHIRTHQSVRTHLVGVDALVDPHLARATNLLAGLEP